MYKKIFLPILFVLIFAFTFCNAQYRRTPQERAQNLKSRLNLTDEQTQKVTGIYQWADSVRSARMNDTSLSRSNIRETMRGTMDSVNVKIENVLTSDQKAEYQKFLQERRRRFQRNNDNG